MCSLQVDPYADEFQQNPFAAYAALRATAPVYQVPDHGFYLITTYALVREVLRDPVTYANSVASARRAEPPPEIAAQIASIRAQGFAYQSALGLSDPPRHTRYRKLVHGAARGSGGVLVVHLGEPGRDSVRSAG